MRIRKLRMLLLLCVFSLVITANPVYADSREVAFKKFLKKMQKDFKSGKEVQCAGTEGYTDVTYYYIDLDNDGKKELIIDEYNKYAYYITKRIYTYKNGKVKRVMNDQGGFFGNILYKVKGTKDFIVEAKCSPDYMYGYCKYKKGKYYIKGFDKWGDSMDINSIGKTFKVTGKLKAVQPKHHDLIYIQYESMLDSPITECRYGKIVVE